MPDKDKEYLMLREEILHLDEIIIHTITFFYAFIATYMIFALPKFDTIYIILMYIVIWPAYVIVLSKARAMYKIGAYLSVFHENSESSNFKWETRNLKFSDSDKPPKFLSLGWVQAHMSAFHFPFFFVNIAALILFLLGTYQNRQDILSLYEGGKILIFCLLFFVTSALIHNHKNASTQNYTDRWKDIRIAESLATEKES